MVKQIEVLDSEQTGTGEGYAFFDCRASKKEIEATIPTIRALVRTPAQLELSLTQGINPREFNNPQLRSIAQDAKDVGLRDTMRTRFRGVGQRNVADEAAGILNQAYQSQLYQDDEKFRGGIFYKENGRYVGRN